MTEVSRGASTSDDCADATVTAHAVGAEQSEQGSKCGSKIEQHHLPCLKTESARSCQSARKFFTSWSGVHVRLLASARLEVEEAEVRCTEAERTAATMGAELRAAEANAAEADTLRMQVAALRERLAEMRAEQVGARNREVSHSHWSMHGQ